MRFSKQALPVVLLFCILVASCKIPAWVGVAEGIAKVAAPMIASVVDIVDPALAPQAKQAQDAFNVLITAFDQYKADPNATTLQAIQSAFAVAAANVSQLLTAVGASGTVPAEVSEILQLVSAAVSEIAALIPEVSTPALTAKFPAPVKHWTAKDFVREYNKIAKGNPKLHALSLQ